MRLSTQDAHALVEAAVYRSYDYPEDSSQAMRLRCLAREIAAEHGQPDPFA